MRGIRPFILLVILGVVDDAATAGIYTLCGRDALPICGGSCCGWIEGWGASGNQKSTRGNSSQNSRAGTCCGWSEGWGASGGRRS